MSKKTNKTTDNIAATTISTMPLKYNELKNNLLTSLTCKVESNSLNILFNCNQQIGYTRLNLN